MEAQRTPLRTRVALGGLFALMVVACAEADGLWTSQSALFSNPGFEDGGLGNWDSGTNLNIDGVIYPPQSISDLQLYDGGWNFTHAVTVKADGGTQIPQGLTAVDSLRYPVFGKWAAVVNEGGFNESVNWLKQQTTVTSADVDPADGKVHVRFVIAPVLQNPGHPLNKQPYFFVNVRNVTQGTVLFETFNYSNQPGVPWKYNLVPAADGGYTDGGIEYTDWSIVDVAPGNAAIAIGDVVEVEVIAAGCQPGGHWGEVYVDGFGSFLDGLSVAASAPQSANAGTNLTYTYLVKNGGQVTADNVTVTIVLPPQTSFVSVSPPAGVTCTTPPAGSVGTTVTCSVGSLPQAGSQTFQMTVLIDAAATGTINHGDYKVDGAVSGAPLPSLLGPLVQTTVTNGVSYADLWATATDGVTVLSWGQADTYTITVGNSGLNAANGARIVDNAPAQLTGATWTCTASGGAACGAASGTGFVNTTANLPAGGQVTLKLQASVIAGTGTGTLNYRVTVSPPASISDPDNSNNTGVDVDNLGASSTLTVTKDPASTGQGTLVSSPAAIDCGPSCASASASFARNTQVSVTATASTGSTFTRWSGGCTGSANPCNLTITADTGLTALFTIDSYSITASSTGNGTISCPASVDYGQSATCTLTPSPGYAVHTLTDNGSDVTSSIANGPSYIIVSATGPHTLVVTFVPGKTNGTGCTRGWECDSGQCVDGVCCDSACSGQCQACNVTGSVGTCSLVKGVPHGSRPACASDGTVCGGTCDGTAPSCVFPSSATLCREPSCSDGTATLAADCDGAGACPAVQTQVCTPYACEQGACASTCSSDGDCSSESFCLDGKCQPRADHSRWKVSGSGGCSSSGGAPLWPAALLALWMVSRRRRSRDFRAGV